jgi:hypothetical protein
LLVEVQRCSTHQCGTQDERAFPPVGWALLQVGEEVAAVVVKQRVCGGHGLGAAERVGLGFVDVAGPADLVGEQLAGQVWAVWFLGRQVADAPGAFADEPP